METEQTKMQQVMLIDNDKYVRESFGTFFETSKIKFLIFKSAAEGLNSLKYQDIDIVISDYFLPDMDGLTLLKRMAEQQPGIATILMATIINDELKTEIYRAGIDAFIEKPLSVTSIDQLIYKLHKKHSKQ